MLRSTILGFLVFTTVLMSSVKLSSAQGYLEVESDALVVLEGGVYLPPRDWNEEEGTGLPAVSDEEIESSGGDGNQAGAVQLFLSRVPLYSDEANINMGAFSYTSLPGDVNCNVLLSPGAASGEALAGGGLDFEGKPVHGINAHAYAAKTLQMLPPVFPLPAGKMLVYHGTMRVNQSGSATAIGASAVGPGFNVAVSTDDIIELAGTVINVLGGTTTTYAVNEADGLVAPFSVEVVPYQNYDITVNSGFDTVAAVYQDSVVAEADAQVSGTVSMVDQASLPAMVTRTVTSL